MLLTCIDENRYLTQIIPDEPVGKYVITDTSGSIPVLCLTGTSVGWAMSAEKGCSFRNKPSSDILKHGMIFKMFYADGHRKISMFVEHQTDDRKRFVRYIVPRGMMVTVGSADNNTIICELPYVESHAFTMCCQPDGCWKMKLNSTEALVYVNERRFFGGTLHIGDLLWFMGEKMIVMPDLISLNNPDGKTRLNSSKIQVLPSPKIKREDAYKAQDVTNYFNRSPRLVKNWNLNDITVDAPPGVVGPDQQNMMFSMAPALTNGLLSLVAGFGSVFTIGNMVSNMVFPTISRKRMQKQRQEYQKKQEEAYKAYLQEIDGKINEKLEEQANHLRKMIPSSEEEINRVFASKKSLWNRRDDQDDCFVVRLGIGDVPLECKVTFPQEHFSVDDNPLMDMLEDFKKKELTVHNVPVSIDLRKTKCCGIAGEIAFRTEQLVNILAQLSIHVGYDELKIWIIGDLYRKAKYISRLPQTWSNDRKSHYFIRSTDDFSVLHEEIDAELARRSQCSQNAMKQKMPFIVIVITDTELVREGRFSHLLFEQKYEKVCIIALGEHSHDLPRTCDAVMRVNDKKGIILRDEEDHLYYSLDHPVSDSLHQLSYIMENTILYIDESSEAIPNVVPFLQLFNTTNVDWLNIGKRWGTNDPAQSLRAPIGIDENGRICELDIHEKMNGPHGLVAGMTGSGKSELLMTYILSMAVSYSPEEVSFLLIDYKGGGMAKAFQNLPHVVGIITNLGGADIARALKSIHSELLRRQEAFQQAQIMFNIPKMEIKQYQQLYRNGKVREPIPHLVIITDEFAELKAQQPEFMQELISVSNIGRSLGVHLILSTQKPSGVVDEKIRSNSRFKICLHVESRADSNDMIKCPDAEMISGVGRFYLDPGYGTLILAQSGWTGAQYSPGLAEVSGAYVDVIDHMGKVIYHSTIHSNSADKNSRHDTQFNVVMEKVVSLATAKRLHLQQLWQPPLEEKILLGELRKKYDIAIEPDKIRVVLGEADDPENQARFPVSLELNEGRHTIIYGMVGVGKDLAVKTIITDIIQTYTPENVWIYVLDYAGDDLSEFASAPHVGDVLSEGEDDKFRRLLNYLKQELEKRKNAAHLGSKNTAKPEKYPAIIVVVHQLNVFLNKLEAINEKDHFVAILDEGPQQNLYFLATAQSTSGISFTIQNRFSQIVLLQLANDDDYSIYPRIGKVRPAQVFGRGLYKRGNDVYEFQTAMPENSIEQMNFSEDGNREGACPPAIPEMPAALSALHMMKYLDKERPFRLPIGLDNNTIQPVFVDGTTKRVHQVIGQQEELCKFSQELMKIGSEMGLKVTVLDSTGTISGDESVRVLQEKQYSEFVEEFYYDRLNAQQNAVDYKGTNQLVIFVGISRILNYLSLQKMEINNKSNDYASILEIFLKNVNMKYDYHTLFIVCDEPQNIQGMKYKKEWYMKQIAETDGIVLNGDLSSSTLTVHTGKDNRIQQKAYPYGYFVYNGKAVYTKFVKNVL